MLWKDQDRVMILAKKVVPVHMPSCSCTSPWYVPQSVSSPRLLYIELRRFGRDLLSSAGGTWLAMFRFSIYLSCSTSILY